MAQRSKSTFQKQEREREKQQKQRDKESRRLEAKKAKSERRPIDGNEDPDIVGIKPGPQPLPDQWQWVPRRDEK
ncbi:MAG: hypothetical protein M0Z81_11750 [Deltaproteobacteria bacterium]|jgi:hypothetical protein|nr:hypothetical protein [Deltaproteobacteria bacterium]